MIQKKVNGHQNQFKTYKQFHSFTLKMDLKNAHFSIPLDKQQRKCIEI